MTADIGLRATAYPHGKNSMYSASTVGPNDVAVLWNYVGGREGHLEVSAGAFSFSQWEKTSGAGKIFENVPAGITITFTGTYYYKSSADNESNFAVGSAIVNIPHSTKIPPDPIPVHKERREKEDDWELPIPPEPEELEYQDPDDPDHWIPIPLGIPQRKNQRVPITFPNMSPGVPKQTKLRWKNGGGGGWVEGPAFEISGGTQGIKGNISYPSGAPPTGVGSVSFIPSDENNPIFTVPVDANGDFESPELPTDTYKLRLGMGQAGTGGTGGDGGADPRTPVEIYSYILVRKKHSDTKEVGTHFDMPGGDEMAKTMFVY